MELSLLQTLKFDLLVKTVFSFLHVLPPLLACFGWSDFETAMQLAMHLADLTLIDFDLSRCAPHLATLAILKIVLHMFCTQPMQAFRMLATMLVDWTAELASTVKQQVSYAIDRLAKLCSEHNVLLSENDDTEIVTHNITDFGKFIDLVPALRVVCSQLH